jgi:methylmalonyl-CoA mutase N-terminal domain/subunit
MAEKERKTHEHTFEQLPCFETAARLPIDEIYRPRDGEDPAYQEKLGDAGEYPFTRGIHRDMYRGKLWTKQFFAGFGRPQDTNQRIRFQIERGVTGLAIPPDLPSQKGIDPDHPFAEGMVGVDGVPTYALKNIDDIFEGIPIDEKHTSIRYTTLTIGFGFAAVVLHAKRRGLNIARLRGSAYNDPLHANFCGYESASPLRLGLKLCVDVIEYCARYMPFFTSVVLGGIEIREKGGNAIHELAFSLAIAKTYIEAALERGLDIDQFAGRMMFAAGTDMDLFEEVAKIRAARRMWARMVREHYGSRDPRNWKLKINIRNCGSSLTRQQPINNVVRTTIADLVAVLAGGQSIESCGYDEAYTIPSENANALGINIQHILSYETGITNTVDPLGGSYYLEALTDQIEEEVTALLEKIEGMGGIMAAIERGWIRDELEREALRRQRDLEEGRRIKVGVNRFSVSEENEIPIDIQRDNTLERLSYEQQEEFHQYKMSRDQERLRTTLEALRQRAGRGEKENLIEPIQEAVLAGGTIAEVTGMIRQAYRLSYDPFNLVEAPF